MTAPMFVNAEVEQTLLGAIILRPGLIGTTEALQPEDFGIPSNRRIYRACVDLSKDGGLDLVTLTTKLSDDLGSVGGAEYLSGLISGVPRLSTVVHYARILKSLSARRAIILALSQANTALADPDVTELEVIDDLLARLQLSRPNPNQGLYTGKELCAAEEADFGSRLREDKVDSVVVPIRSLEKVVTIGRGDFVVLGARPSVGKSSFLAGMTDENIRQGRKVFHLACEMQLLRNTWRFFAIHSGLPLHKIKFPRNQKSEDNAAYLNAFTFYEAVQNFIFGYLPRPRISEVQDAIKAAEKRMGGLDLVVLDYFQKVQPDRRSKDSFVERSEVASRLAAMAGELNVPILCGCQLNRNAESDHEKDKPSKSELKGTGSLEEEATTVLLLHRWGMLSSSCDLGGAEIIVAKQQDGPCGICEARFVKEGARWETA